MSDDYYYSGLYAEEQAEAEARLTAAQQPAEGEEIMVNTPYDVFTLPLQPSGLSSGPRFVVHVPGPEQPAAVDEAMVFRLAVWMAKHDGCEDPHRLIYEGSPPVPWGEVWNRYEYDARAALTAAIAQQPAAPSGAVNVIGMPEFDGLLDHIYEYGTAAEGVIEKANAFARAVIARYAPHTT
jgi:hypothetical protein